MKSFDLVHTPLEGINLIEASAGTGKTYAIEGLFVRLVVEKRLPVDQILVVTFTKAATAELKDRIRRKLIQAQAGFSQGASDDPFVPELVRKTAERTLPSDLLGEALADFDRASIFTIHGFCQRFLYEYAFETGSAFDAALVSDPTDLIHEVVDDFWRQHFYQAPVEFVSYCLQARKTPAYFYQLLIRGCRPGVTVIPFMEAPSTPALTAFRSALESLKSGWPDSREAVIRVLNDPALHGSIYGSLKPDAKLSGMSRRQLKIQTLVAAMDAMADPKSTGFPLLPGFDKLTRSKLAAATRKHQNTPDHGFFDLCEELHLNAARLTSEFETLLLYVKQQAIRSGRAELATRKRIRNIQFFDDLLLLVQAALMSQNSSTLVSYVRRRFRAALVDEFQDTDSVQYDIFSRLFAADDGSLFMIGDPKQAIYGFRGADIFSYLRAVRDTRCRFTLTTNYRSHAGLIEAVNTMFSQVPRPFVFDDIGFHKARAAGGSLSQQKDAAPPLTLWYLDPGRFSAPNKPINKTKATQCIARAVAWEILRLLSCEAPQREAEDIAVLVRTNRQAHLIKQDLNRLRIPAVLHSTGDIFDTGEALELQQVLAAIAEPNSMRRLNAALVTDMLGISGNELAGVDEAARWWQARMSRTRHYHDLWRQHGFMRMFHQVLADEGIKGRLIQFEDGERRLTNVLHLSEVLHRQSLTTNFGMSGLLKWLAEQRAAPTRRLEEQLLRLESDEKAVRIVTIHKSKGLEYPVVFCPFVWEGVSVSDEEVLFHDGDNDKRLTLDLDAKADPGHLILARNEQLAENLRVLYVALTRAQQACYLAWGRIRSAYNSALAYLLHSKYADDLPEDLTGDLEQRFEARTDSELMSDLDGLVRQSNGGIRHIPLPEAPVDAVVPDRTAAPLELKCREFAGTVDHSWRVSSYSSLLSQQTAQPDMPDRDTLPESIWLASDDPDGAIGLERPRDICAFPKGARTGLFFHEIFERIPFGARHQDTRRTLIAGKLQEYGFEPDWLEPVHAAVEAVLSVRLRSDRGDLVLSDVGQDRRIHEMEFYFPLATVRPQTLQHILRRSSLGSVCGELPHRLESLEFAPTRGFMKGFIDLIFEHRGVFYLLDWKTNYLGPSLAHYAEDKLAKAMAEHYYVLQYLLYTLAVHRHLGLRTAQYRYEQHFGGIFYLFIRGVDTEKGSDFGVFHDRPDSNLIRSLGKALIPGFHESDRI